MTGAPRPTPSAPCPTCGGQALLGPDNAARPFCSSRCKWVDLGRWLDGTYRVPAEADDDDLPPPPLPASDDPSADRY